MIDVARCVVSWRDGGGGAYLPAMPASRGREASAAGGGGGPYAPAGPPRSGGPATGPPPGGSQRWTLLSAPGATESTLDVVVTAEGNRRKATPNVGRPDARLVPEGCLHVRTIKSRSPVTPGHIWHDSTTQQSKQQSVQ